MGNPLPTRRPCGWRVAGHSARGAAHIRDGRPRQDAVAWRANPCGVGPVVLAVSDGHGSPRCVRSDIGARIATETAARLVHRFVRASVGRAQPAVRKAAERELPATLVAAWKKAVLGHLAAHPFTAAEQAAVAGDGGGDAARLLAYGATLIVVAVSASSILYLQLGDGDILAVSDPPVGAVNPIPRDDALIANETTSLCMDDAAQHVRVVIRNLSTVPPAMILASTDGYSNSFSTPADFRKVGPDFLAIARMDGWATLESHLPGWLEEASRDGSGDDVTLGILCRQDVLGGTRGGNRDEPETAPAHEDRASADEKTGGEGTP